MTDKELADKIVALGVGECDGLGHARNGSHWYSLEASDLGGLCDELFVHSWIVAGALMEKCKEFERIIYYQKTNIWDIEISSSKYVCESNESLPRAINEACVEALND